jgi:PAS domain S-box-containing protein
MVNDQSKKCTAIVEGSRDGILLLNSDGCIESANAAVLAGFETSLREIRGKPLNSLIPLLKNDSAPESFLQDLVRSTDTISEEKCISMELNGQLRHFEIRAHVLEVEASRKYTVMVRDATEKHRIQLNLEEANRQLIESAHRAGKAEVAKCVIHNVGNVLTNMNILASAMESKVRSSRLSGLSRGAELIQNHSDDLTTFLTEDQRGRQLPEYFVELAHCWESDAEDLLSKLNSLTSSLEHANHIVEAQHDTADSAGFIERVSLSSLLNKSLAMSAASLDRHSIALETELDSAPVALLDTNRLLQVLVNLITNAKQALCECAIENRKIRVKLYAHGNDRFKIEVSDNGPGIDQDRISRIFNRGFTTKSNGHGFGLHYSAIAIQQMGGQIEVFSKGQNQGSTFTIDLPLDQRKRVTA